MGLVLVLVLLLLMMAAGSLAKVETSVSLVNNERPRCARILVSNFYGAPLFLFYFSEKNTVTAVYSRNS